VCAQELLHGILGDESILFQLPEDTLRDFGLPSQGISSFDHPQKDFGDK
jgi:hypothetical protein